MYTLSAFKTVCRLVFLACLVCPAHAALAQTQPPPFHTVEFDPSPDHDALSGSGVPRVDTYILTLYASGSSTPFESLVLGKPDPSTDGIIRVEFLSRLTTTLMSGVEYRARVAASGPEGVGASSLSDAFVLPPPCSATLGSSSYAAGATGATASVAVSTAAGCTWDATSNVSWTTIVSGANGSGNGTVTFVVADTGVSGPRTGTLSVAGHPFTVTQDGLSCGYVLSPGSQAFSASGGNAMLSVAAPAGCGWSAASSAAWLTVTSSSDGSGSATLAYTVAAHTGNVARTAALTIGGQTLNVTQGAVGCSYGVSPLAQAVGNAATTVVINVETSSGCAWSASSSSGWLAPGQGESGHGSGSVVFAAATNDSGGSRTGYLLIAGHAIEILQTASCSYTVLASSQTFAAAGGTASVGVAAPTGCSWSASSGASWVTITAGASTNGGGPVLFSVASHRGTSARTATLSIAGQPFTVTQAAAPCSFGVTPVTHAVLTAGGSATVAVSAPIGCSWTVASQDAWLTPQLGASSTGSGSVTFSVSGNSQSASRSGTLLVAGAIITVTQGGVTGCTYTLAPATRSINARLTTGHIAVTRTASCVSTPTSTVDWITVTAIASDGRISYLVDKNDSGASRTGGIELDGEIFTLEQRADSLPTKPASVRITGGR